MENFIFDVDLKTFSEQINSSDPKERIKAIESVRDISKKSIKAKEILNILINALSNEEDPQIISRLTKLIGKFGDSSVINLLKKYLWHPDSRVVANTIEGLGYIYSLDIIPLILPFLNSNDNRIKANAARALYNLNPEAALEKLTEMLNSDEIFFKDSATYILASICDIPCQEKLIEILVNENDTAILKKCTLALSNKGDETTIEKLNKFIEQNPNHSKIDILNDIIDAIKHRLNEQKASLETISKLNDIQKLIEIYNNGSNKEKELVCLRLYEIGDESALPFLKKAANDDDNTIRYAAKKAINNIFNKAIRKNELQTFKNFTSTTKITDIKSSNVKKEDNYANILNIIDKSSDTTYEKKQLEEIDLAFLVLDLNNENPVVRAEAVSKLLYANHKTKGVKEAVKYLVERLHIETEPQVKSQMLRVIGALGSKSEIPILKKYIEDETLDYRIRANALEGLGCIDDPEVFEIIKPYLNHSDNRIKANAVIAAWKRNPDLTYNVISDMIRSPNVAMRDSAAYGLLMLKSHDKKIINLMLELFIRETVPDIITKLTQGLSLLGDEKILNDMQKLLPNASALKKPYIESIINKIKQKLDDIKNFNAKNTISEKEHISEFDLQYNEYIKSESQNIKKPKIEITSDEDKNQKSKEINKNLTYERSDGTYAPLKSIEAHLFEFNHPDEKVRLNAILAIKQHLILGVTHDQLVQIEMMLTLSLNDASLKVRKEAFEAYQMIQTHRVSHKK